MDLRGRRNVLFLGNGVVAPGPADTLWGSGPSSPPTKWKCDDDGVRVRIGGALPRPVVLVATAAVLAVGCSFSGGPAPRAGQRPSATGSPAASSVAAPASDSPHG
jgi:hypothetical protein